MTISGGSETAGGMDLDPRDVARAIEESIAAYWLALGHGPRGSVSADAEVAWAYTGHSTMNRVVRARLDERTADARIADLAGTFAARGATLSWIVTPLSTPPDLADRLRARGFEQADSLCGMAIDLDRAPQLLAPQPAPEGLEIREIVGAPRPDQRQTHRDWLRIVKETFGLPASALDVLRDPSVGDGAYGRPPWHRYVAYLHGRPAATATLVPTRRPGAGPDVAGLYLVATLPEAERQGLATFLTHRALQTASGLGCRLAVLQATDPARELYHRLGFREYAPVTVFRHRSFLARLTDARDRTLRSVFPGIAPVPAPLVALGFLVFSLLVLFLAVAGARGAARSAVGRLGRSDAPPSAAGGPAAPAPPTPTPVPPTPTPVPPTPTPDPRGSIVERRQLAVYSAAQINQLAPRSYPAGTAPGARYAVEQHFLRFVSTDEKTGAPFNVTAHLYVPRLDAPAALPVVVYGAGTTGLADQCAPTNEQPTVRNWGDYLVHMLTYAGQGYIAILPDYAGLNDDSRLNRYFIAESESRVLMDAARAVYALYATQPFAGTPAAPGTPSEALFFGGYSVGGHAAFAVRDTIASYAPGLPIKGVIGHGASTDVTALLRDSAYFAPYVFQSYADYYGPSVVEVGRLLQPRWANTLAADVNARCIDAMPGYYGTNPNALYQPAFQDALFNNRLEQGFPALKEALDRNSTGLVRSNVPALVVQGAGDPIVTARTQDAFVAKLCAAGGRVTYVSYPGVHHFQTRQIGFRDTLSWMQTVASGAAPRNTCPG